MSLPIALQLYSLREALAEDFAGVVGKVAAMGYAGVETAGFNGTTPQAAADLFKQLGLTVASAHSPLPLGENRNQVLDTMGLLDCKRLICPFMPPDQFKSDDSIKAICDQLNEAGAVARDNGLSFYYHNHWWEYEFEVGGRPAYQVMLDHLEPFVLMEIDTYWVKVGGKDPAAVIRELGARVPLLHIKDGPVTKDEPMTAVGDGVMDWPPVIQAGQGRAEWLIVELDRCATDMVEAVRRSYNYLVGKGYAHGR